MKNLQNTTESPSDNGDKEMTPAAQRANLKDLASIYGGKLRVRGVGNEVQTAWAKFCAGVDAALPDLEGCGHDKT